MGLNNHVDNILTFFDPLPPLDGQILTFLLPSSYAHMDIMDICQPPSPPYLVHVVIERPLNLTFKIFWISQLLLWYIDYFYLYTEIHDLYYSCHWPMKVNLLHIYSFAILLVIYGGLR